MASLDTHAQSKADTLPPAPPPSPANGVEGPLYWCYHDLFPNFHQLNTKYQLRLPKDNCPLKTDGSTMNKDEQKKYELVLTETALLVFREHRNPRGLLGVLDGFPEGSLDLGKIILNTVSYACDIALKEVQMALNLRILTGPEGCRLRGGCDRCGCEQCDYSPNGVEYDPTTCQACNHGIEHHHLLLTHRGRIQAKLEAEFEQLGKVLNTVHKENWGNSGLGHDWRTKLFE